MAKKDNSRRCFSAFGRWVLFLFFGFFSVLTQAQPIDEVAALEFGYVEQPPRTFTNAQGKAEGQVIRLVSDLFTKAGLTWRPVSYPAARLFENLKDGTTAISVLIRIPSLEPYCLWSKVDLGGEDIRVYSIGDRAAIKSREDLVGRNVIALRGYSYGNLMGFLMDDKNNITLSLAASNPDSFEMLLAGRADYLVQYAEASERVLAAKPIQGIRYDVIGRISRHLVISRAMPDAEKTMERLERILKTMDIPEYMKSPRK
jgi:polar amino acid transport system substrate-binding protein